MDDAAGLQIATRLKAQTSGMAVAMRNTQNSISMLQTAEGALDEVTNILVRMKDLATQSADGSSSAADKGAMQSEYDSLASELSNIMGNTSFGGGKLMNRKATGTEPADAVTAANNAATATTATDTAHTNAKNAYDTAKGLSDAAPTNLTLKADTDAKKAAFDLALQAKTEADNLKGATAAYSAAAAASAVAAVKNGSLSAAISFQIGASSGESMSLDLSTDMTSLHAALRTVSGNYNSFGAAISFTGTELTKSASTMIDNLKTAIEEVSSVRSGIGAAANRLDHVHNNLANISTNTANATGRIMDVDFATESAKMTSNQMLMQAGTAMLKQSNSMSSMVMSLLQ